MQASDEKSWERFVDKVMQDAAPESLNDDFTDGVLGALETLQDKAEATTYKAPISRLSWVILGFIVVGVLAWSTLGGIGTEWNWVSWIQGDLSLEAILGSYTLPELEFTSSYSIGILAIFVIFQLLLMKRSFDRKLSLE